MPFIDLDEAIEIETGQTIEVLINKWGEPLFREIEHTVLKKLLTLPHFVMATGGGTACFHDNINMINATGISIYISMRAEALAQRLIRARKPRPLLANIAPGDLSSHIALMLQQREPYYLKAHFIVDGCKKPLEQISKIIVDSDKSDS